MLQGVKSRLAPCAFGCVSWPVALDMFTRVCRPYLLHRKSLFRSFVIFFLNVTWCFKLLSCESYLDVLNTGHPPDTSSAGIPPLLGCLFISWRHHLQHKCGDFCVHPCHPAVTWRSLQRPFPTLLGHPDSQAGCVWAMSLQSWSPRVTPFSCNRARRQEVFPLWTGRRVSSSFPTSTRIYGSQYK